jgi:hypothetical protein
MKRGERNDERDGEINLEGMNGGNSRTETEETKCGRTLIL